MKRIFQIGCFALSIFVITLGFNKIRFRYEWSDATKRTLMAPFAGTLWADGFSEEKFAKVTLGMPMSEVERLLGRPLKEWCGPEDDKTGCTWLYSWQDTPTADYDRRWVSFNASGRVDELRHDFFID